MITIEQTVERSTRGFKQEMSNMRIHMENKLEKDILQSQQKLVSLILTVSGIIIAAIGIATAIISFFLHQ